MFDSTSVSSSLLASSTYSHNNPIGGYSVWYKQSSIPPIPRQPAHSKSILRQAHMFRGWHEMSPEVVPPAISPRQLPRRLTPMQTDPNSVRPPPPTPNYRQRLENDLLALRPEDDLTVTQHAKKQKLLSVAAFPIGTGKRAIGSRSKQSLPPMPVRGVPLLRRSQGVAFAGCPCCRRYRDLKPEAILKLKW